MHKLIVFFFMRMRNVILYLYQREVTAYIFIQLFFYVVRGCSCGFRFVKSSLNSISGGVESNINLY